MQNELIQITEQKINNELKQTTNARDLWKYLESKQDFSTWIKGRLIEFQENADYIKFHKIMEQVSGTKNLIEYHLTLETAKHIAMIERNDKGRQIRQYFIDFENKAKNQLLNLSRKQILQMALEAEEQNEKMQLQIEEQDKQITYYDEMLIAEGTFCLQDGAKILHLRPNKFIEALRIKGYLTKSDLAQQDYINNGCFITKTVIIDNNRGVKKEKKQARITAKGIAYFAKKVLTDFADILDKPTSKKIFEKIKKNDKSENILKLLNNAN
jgi:anti-repressor protein